MVSAVGGHPFVVYVERRGAVDYELTRWRRRGFLAVTLTEWVDYGESFWPPAPEDTGHLDHIIGNRGRRSVT